MTAFASSPLGIASSSFLALRTCLHCPLPNRTSRRAQRISPSMVAKPENEPDAAVSATVERLYDTYPFPPETLLDEAPLGYNWRWHYPSAYSFCTGQLPAPRDTPLRILDAGCGTGESTSYLVHLNPTAEVTAMDLSNGALDVARERLQRSVPDAVDRCTFVHKSIFDAADLPGLYDHINCVGVVHHTPDPLRAVRALADKLAPGGILHIFVYAAHGRWEISLMQRALHLLQRGERKFEDGVELGRRVFKTLPDGNRLKERENSRWAQENLKDATFADMYLHPQEVDYDIPSLFELIDGSGLDFVGFSNPRVWDLQRLLGNDPELLKSANALPERERYRLVELLDPETITHFEFFLGKPPISRQDWTDDSVLKNAKPQMSECITGWPSTVLMDRDYMPIMLSENEVAFMKEVIDGDSATVGEVASKVGAEMQDVRELLRKGVLLLLQS